MAEKRYGLRDLASMPRGRRLPFLWTYYRLHLLGILVGAVCLALFIGSVCGRREPDFEVLALCAPITADETAALEAEFSAFFPDYNGDGTNEVAVLHLPVMSADTAETSTLAISISALTAGEAPLLLLNRSAAEVLLTYGALADAAGAPVETLEDAFCAPAELFEQFSIPAREPLWFYRAVLPDDHHALLETQADLFARLTAQP